VPAALGVLRKIVAITKSQKQGEYDKRGEKTRSSNPNEAEHVHFRKVVETIYPEDNR